VLNHTSRFQIKQGSFNFYQFYIVCSKCATLALGVLGIWQADVLLQVN